MTIPNRSRGWMIIGNKLYVSIHGGVLIIVAKDTTAFVIEGDRVEYGPQKNIDYTHFISNNEYQWDQLKMEYVRS